MRKHTFTVFSENNEIYGYLFNVTRTEAQETVTDINKESHENHYYIEGYFE